MTFFLSNCFPASVMDSLPRPPELFTSEFQCLNDCIHTDGLQAFRRDAPMSKGPEGPHRFFVDMTLFTVRSRCPFPFYGLRSGDENTRELHPSHWIILVNDPQRPTSIITLQDKGQEMRQPKFRYKICFRCNIYLEVRAETTLTDWLTDWQTD